MLIESIKDARIEQIITGWYTGRKVVCLDDRVVGRVEFKDDHVAYTRSDIVRNVSVWIGLGPNLDSMCGCPRKGGR